MVSAPKCVPDAKGLVADKPVLIRRRAELSDQQRELSRLERGMQADLEVLRSMAEDLDRWSWAAAWRTLLGDRSATIAAYQQEIERLEAEIQDAQPRLVELTESLRNLEAEIEDAEAAANERSRLAIQREESLAQREDELGAKVRSLRDRERAGREDLRTVELAMEAGEQLLQRVESMTAAFGRIRKRLFSLQGVRPLAGALNVAQKHGAMPHVGRVREALVRLSERSSVVSMPASSPYHVEVVRLIGAIQEHAATLTRVWTMEAVDDASAVDGLAADTRDLVRFLDERKDELARDVNAIRAELGVVLNSGSDSPPTESPAVPVGSGEASIPGAEAVVQSHKNGFVW